MVGDDVRRTGGRPFQEAEVWPDESGHRAQLRAVANGRGCTRAREYSALSGRVRRMPVPFSGKRRWRDRVGDMGILLPGSQRGFTLIELAIVLVILGLLLGGVVKGQELITGARVRGLVAQQEGIKAAFFGFQDRFRAIAGDFAFASRSLRCPAGRTCLNGNGNGIIEDRAVPETVDGTRSEIHEELLAWMHLTSAGFLNASHTMNPGDAAPTDGNSPKNSSNIYLQIIYDGKYANAGAPVSKHNLKTGSQLSVEILAEVDRKIDDGNGTRGAFRYSTYIGNAASAPVDPTPAYAPGQCMMPTGAWYISHGEANCGGASLL